MLVTDQAESDGCDRDPALHAAVLAAVEGGAHAPRPDTLPRRSGLQVRQALFPLGRLALVMLLLGSTAAAEAKVSYFRVFLVLIMIL